MQVHYKGVDYQHSVRPHGCEDPSVPSKIVIHLAVMMMLCTLNFYTIIVLFFCLSLSC